MASDGLTATIERKHCGNGRPVSEACGDSYVNVTVSFRGGAPVTLEGAAGLRWYIGIGPLGRDPRPALILVTDMGGSGGCVTVDAALPRNEGYRTVRLRLDGAASLCRVDPGKLTWPQDVAGRGRSELLLNDDRFDCTFASCAASWTPPRVVALDGERFVDVSADLSLSPLYRADMVRARVACEHIREEPAAPCAAFAADAARLGQLAQARAFIDGQVRRGCRIAHDPCYAINDFPPAFATNLMEFLAATGIDGSQTASQPYRRRRYVPSLGLALLPDTK